VIMAEYCSLNLWIELKFNTTKVTGIIMNPMAETRKTNVQLSPMILHFLAIFVFIRKRFVNISFMHLSQN
jgi:hypothetical protein